MGAIRAIGALALETNVQSCSTTTCTTACLVFDASWNTCHYDWANKGFDSLTSCVCRWDGLSATLAALGQCTACQQDGLASNTLEMYQYYAVICNTYLTEGEGSAASAVANTPTATVLAVFTSVYLPVIESGQCQQSASSTATTTTSSISTTFSTASGTSDTTSLNVTPTGISTTMSSSTSPIPTPNAANERAGWLGALLAVSALLHLVIG